MMDIATKNQNVAADPDQSTWLSANAGSGKTRVLTDRVARLLLRGVEPQNILCLTYTKAAASEMQNRLFSTLGSWAMEADADLHNKLLALGEDPRDDLSDARRLFAGAIEAPGGLKIQTIHSFCSAVLRQFPLEAGVTPQFRELDEADQKALIEEVLNTLADRSAFREMARINSDQDMIALARGIAGKRVEFSSPLTKEQVFERFGVPKGRTFRDILDIAFNDGDWAFLKEIAPALRHSSKKNTLSAADVIAAALDHPARHALAALEGCLLYGNSLKDPFGPKIGEFPDKTLRESAAFAGYVPRLNDIMRQVAYARRARIQLEAAEKTAALHAFARVFLPAYEGAKSDGGLLDFDDLIQKTKILLGNASLAWVLYRLDSRIDHILVDEAQDTSPIQWDVITSISDEITAGQGSCENRPRTLFVVGDKKQSIYSFQGADADGFDRMSARLQEKLQDGQGLKQRQLLHSFRSSPAILKSVDHVFDDPMLPGLGDTVVHEAFHATKPGRVDLWDLIQLDENEEDPDWYDPRDRPTRSDPAVVLSERLAGEIRRMIETETIKDKKGEIRRIEPKDILILVRRRSDIFHQIISACKAADLPIAGADRLKLGGALAVKDLLALLNFLALQDDSLSLAAALKSPIFGWSEQELYTLAQGSGKTLWAKLRDRADQHPMTMEILNDLRNHVELLRPYELLERILSRHAGRRKLIGRLGAEAEDGIDELLNLSLSYEIDDVPSLTGFLAQAQNAEIEVKRQADSTGNLIRVMTVHGAKGLESPIVFLPDTTPQVRSISNEVLIGPDHLPVWPVSKEESPDLIKLAKEEYTTAERKERNRLLYVAMTRAESWLIVCGKAPARNAPTAEKTWHQIVHEGLERAGAKRIETEVGPVLRLAEGEWPAPEATRPLGKQVMTSAPQDPLLTLSVPAAEAMPVRLSPSKLGGEKTIGGGALEEPEAMKKGTQIHLLLEHLPKHADHKHLAETLLSKGPNRADAADIPVLLAEALQNIKAHPDLFADDTLAEVDIAAHVPGLSSKVFGTIDRLVITPDRILAVDFKTNASIPRRVEDTPEGLLRQMGAYLEALEQIWPDRLIEVAILWTVSSDLMVLPHGIVRDALQRATTS